MSNKICPRCGIEKPLEAYLPSHRTNRKHACKECRNEIARDYKFTDGGKKALEKARAREKTNGYQANYQRQYSQKPEMIAHNRAKRILRTAADNGIIKRKPCELCGEPKTEAHHPDYNKPLEVMWLCRPCHRKLHLKQGKMPEE